MTTPMTDDVKLEPCPLCNDPMEHIRGLIRHVHQGDCLMGQQAYDETNVERWNRRATLPAPAVAVKPLEWEEGDNGLLYAKTALGVFEINERYSSVTLEVPIGRHGDSLVLWRQDFPVPTAPSALMASAQAEFDKRIRSALVEPAPAVAVPEAIANLLDGLRSSFCTAISGSEGYFINLKYPTLKEMQEAHNSIIHALKMDAAAPEPPASPPPPEPTHEDLVAFGASDAAVYHYPGGEQQDLRAAFIAGAVYASPPPAEMWSPKDEASQDQMAAVMLLHGTSDQQRQAAEYAGLPPPAQEVKAEPVAFTSQGWLDTAQRKLGPGSFWVTAQNGPTEVPLYLASPSHADGIREGIERAAKVADMAVNDFNGTEKAGMARAIAMRIRALKGPRDDR